MTSKEITTYFKKDLNRPENAKHSKQVFEDKQISTGSISKDELREFYRNIL